MANEPQNSAPEGTIHDDAQHAHVGPVLGILIVVLILILGGLYLWGSMLQENTALETTERTLPNNEPETPRAQADQDILMTTSSSVEIEAIYADLESTNLNDLDSELDTIDTEMRTTAR